MDEDQERRYALQHAVGKIGERMVAEVPGTLPLSAAAVSTLTEVVLRYIKVATLDLKHFAKHGKRAGVSTEDVKLLARKMPELVQDLEAFEAAHLVKDKASAPRKRRKEATESTTKSKRHDASGWAHRQSKDSSHRGRGALEAVLGKRGGFLLDDDDDNEEEEDEHRREHHEHSDNPDFNSRLGLSALGEPDASMEPTAPRAASHADGERPPEFVDLCDSDDSAV